MQHPTSSSNLIQRSNESTLHWHKTQKKTSICCSQFEFSVLRGTMIRIRITTARVGRPACSRGGARLSRAEAEDNEDSDTTQVGPSVAATPECFDSQNVVCV